MSLSLSIVNGIVNVNKITLPSRYFVFDEAKERYIKLLTVGEGVFPKDRIDHQIVLENSSLVLANESACKVYKNLGEKSARVRYNLRLKNSAAEFINDELILFEMAKLFHFLRVSFDRASFFFYCDLLSGGRSYESFDFERLSVQNTFIFEDQTEYLERFTIGGAELKDYHRRHNGGSLFAKIYVKPAEIESFAAALRDMGVTSYEWTRSRVMLLIVLLGDTIAALKKQIVSIWQAYRANMGKQPFDLGKR
ncbi:MAG: urease accessory protein UreD [Helicobacteraceae bacterium]|jgi:urease accessory protein|nr:urease accessory protein UreD [Helicobacteraceae bacterium]